MNEYETLILRMDDIMTSDKPIQVRNQLMSNVITNYYIAKKSDDMHILKVNTISTNLVLLFLHAHQSNSFPSVNKLGLIEIRRIVKSLEEFEELESILVLLIASNGYNRCSVNMYFLTTSIKVMIEKSGMSASKISTILYGNDTELSAKLNGTKWLTTLDVYGITNTITREGCPIDMIKATRLKGDRLDISKDMLAMETGFLLESRPSNSPRIIIGEPRS